MRIGGLLKFSMIDFPGRISAIVFTQGCNLNCAYCHNPELISPASSAIGQSEEDILSYLDKRKNSLDGVVITGGEPTLQPDLAEFILKIRALGYLVKLDTNGTMPEVVQDLIDRKLVDFIAMDIKAPFDKYDAICQKHIETSAVQRTMDIIRASGIEHEFRTTYYKKVLNDSDIERIKQMAPDNFRVQECLPVKTKDTLKVEH